MYQYDYRSEALYFLVKNSAFLRFGYDYRSDLSMIIVVGHFLFFTSNDLGAFFVGSQSSLPLQTLMGRHVKA